MKQAFGKISDIYRKKRSFRIASIALLVFVVFLIGLFIFFIKTQNSLHSQLQNCTTTYRQYFNKVERFDKADAAKVISQYSSKQYCVSDNLEITQFKKLPLEERKTILYSNYVLANAYHYHGDKKSAQTLARKTLDYSDNGLSSNERITMNREYDIVSELTYIGYNQ